MSKAIPSENPEGLPEISRGLYLGLISISPTGLETFNVGNAKLAMALHRPRCLPAAVPCNSFPPNALRQGVLSYKSFTASPRKVWARKFHPLTP